MNKTITKEELKELKEEYNINNRELSFIGKERVEEHAGKGECEGLFYSRLPEKVKYLYACVRDHRHRQAYLQECIFKNRYSTGGISKLYKAMELEERSFLDVALWVLDIEKKIEEDAKILESLNKKLSFIKGNIQDLIMLGAFLDEEQKENQKKIVSALRKVSEIESALERIEKV